MSTRNGLIKALAINCAAECVYQGMSSDGSLASDDDGVTLIAEDASPTIHDFEALDDTLDGTASSADRVLFTETFTETVSTLLKVIPRGEGLVDKILGLIPGGKS